jgi:phosphopentomutase
VFQIAAHEDVIPIPQLYKLCGIAREMLVGDLFIGRVIARPFVGEAGAFKRTENRKDYAVPPTGVTLLDALEERGQTTLGIGKIEDIFCNCGVAHVNHTTNNADGIAATIDALKNNREDTVIFTNLVDFDMKYGHRNDAEGYAKALEAFDAELPGITAALRPNDLLIITADHGCDPTTQGTDHTREYVPLLALSQNIKCQNLGTRDTFADIAATIFKGLGHGSWSIGKNFL